MARVIAFSLFIYLTFNLNAQNTWIHPGLTIDWNTRAMWVDSITNRLYVGGNLSKVNGLRCDGSFYIDSSGVHIIDSNTIWGNQFLPLSFTRYNGDILMGAWDGLYRMDSTGWDSLAFGSRALAIIVDFHHIDSSLLICTVWDSIDGVKLSGVTQYDGSSFSDFNGFADSIVWPSTRVSVIEEYQGNIILGGSYRIDKWSNMFLWDSKKWDNMDGGLGDDQTHWITDLIVYKGELYAAGSFFDYMAPNHGISAIARWDGISWKPLGNGLHFWDQVVDMVVYQDKLWVGGYIKSAGFLPARNIAAWDGIAWSVPQDTLTREVHNMVVYNDELWVGGNFEMVQGDSTLNYLIKYDTTSPLIYDSLYMYYGVDEINEEDEINIYPNPSTGKFTIQVPEKGEVYIYNSIGSLIIKRQISDKGKFEIDIASSNQGMYYLKYVMRNSISTKKIIIH